MPTARLDTLKPSDRFMRGGVYVTAKTIEPSHADVPGDKRLTIITTQGERYVGLTTQYVFTPA